MAFNSSIVKTQSYSRPTSLPLSAEELKDAILRRSGEDTSSLNRLIKLCNDCRDSQAMEQLSLVYDSYPKQVELALRNNNKPLEQWRFQLGQSFANIIERRLARTELPDLVEFAQQNDRVAFLSAKEIIRRFVTSYGNHKLILARSLEALDSLGKKLAKEGDSRLADRLKVAAREVVIENDLMTLHQMTELNYDFLPTLLHPFVSRQEDNSNMNQDDCKE